MAAKARNGGFTAILKNRDFLLIWLAQLISMTIFYASNYALLVLIEEVTGSTTLVGLGIICFSLPAVLFGAPAGVYVDRMDKRLVLWGSNTLRALATFVFAISLLVDRHQLVPVYLLTLLISSIGQFFTPAEGSSIPLLVGGEELLPALSLFNITFMLSQALGFIILAPIVLSLVPTFSVAGLTIQPIESLYILIAILYGVCAILTFMLPPSKLAEPTHKVRRSASTQSGMGVVSGMWTEIVQGWAFIRRNKRLYLAVVQLSFAGVLLLVIGQLATPIVTKLLHLSPNAMAFIFAPAGIGLVIGSILMPRIAVRLGKSRAVLIGCLALTCVTLLLPLSTLLARTLQPAGWNTNPLLLFTVALLMFIAGFALDFINIPALTAIQEMTPDWIKGRVLALQLMLYNAAGIPVILFIGAIADNFGLDRVLYLMSVCILAFSLWGQYYARKYPREAGAGQPKLEEILVEQEKLPTQP
jgi:MFS family permease